VEVGVLTAGSWLRTLRSPVCGENAGRVRNCVTASDLQVIASPDGGIVWVSGPLPGSVHDKKAEWIWGVHEPEAVGLVQCRLVKNWMQNGQDWFVAASGVGWLLHREGAAFVFLDDAGIRPFAAAVTEPFSSWR
jgi:hypothetical protein